MKSLIKFFEAVKSGNLKKIKKYIKIHNINDDEILFYSIREHYNDVVKYLLNHYYNNDIYPQCLTEATYSGNLDIVKFITKKDTKVYDSLLSLAVYYNRLPIVKFFTKRDFSEGIFQKSLMTAFSGGHLDIIKYLIKEKNLHYDNYDVLYDAVRHRQVDIIKYLVENGANPNILNIFNFLLEYRSGNLELLKTLIDNDVDINIDNGAALKNSIQSGSFDIVQFLIENGAKINLIDNWSLEMAALNGNFNILNFLEKKGLNINYSKLYSAILKHILRKE